MNDLLNKKLEELEKKKRITVKTLIEDLSVFPPDTEISFRNSLFVDKPLVYYRVTANGDNLVELQLTALNEADLNT